MPPYRTRKRNSDDCIELPWRCQHGPYAAAATRCLSQPVEAQSARSDLVPLHCGFSFQPHSPSRGFVPPGVIMRWTHPQSSKSRHQWRVAAVLPGDCPRGIGGKLQGQPLDRDLGDASRRACAAWRAGRGANAPPPGGLSATARSRPQGRHHTAGQTLRGAHHVAQQLARAGGACVVCQDNSVGTAANFTMVLVCNRC